MPSCVFRGCRNYTETVKGRKDISFHSLPKDGLQKEKWIKIIRKQRDDDDWLSTEYSKICSEHFLTNDVYMTDKNVRRLKKSAVPVIKKKVKLTVSPVSSPTSSNHEHISDEDSIFDASRKAYMKGKLSKVFQVKQKLNNKNVTRKNKSLKTKCNDLKTVVFKLKQKNFLTVDQFNELKLKAEAVKLTYRLMKNNNSKNYRKIYTPALRKFAVTLHYYSAAAYKYVRQVFKEVLPHPRVISKWYENNSGDPGFTKQALDMLDKKHKISGKRILCTLVADEMAIRHQSIWTGKENTGVVDFGASSPKTYEIATQAYVFTLVCMDENWKIPVGYFLVNGLSAEVRANLLRTCLSECYHVGVDIVAITFDGCSANLNTANLLGCNLNNPGNLKTTFKHPECETEVAVMIDACHMIKLVRNSLEAKRLFIDKNGKEIRWQLLVNLVRLQKNTGLNFANKITTRHIQFRNEIMKVKLATQIMSMRVANALKLCSELIKSSLFLDTDGTIEFITIFNNLFDILNSNSYDFFGLKKPLSAQNADEVLTYLEKVKEYILGLTIFTKYRKVFSKCITWKIKKLILDAKTNTGFLGFLVCIESIKHLYKTLIETQRLKYIATYRLSQDHIEILFGVIRRHGGYNNYPNAIQFKGLYKKLLEHLEMKSSYLQNYVTLEDVPILTCSSAVQNINTTCGKRAFDDECITLDAVDGYTEADFVIDGNTEILTTLLNRQSVLATTDQIVGYISGWVSRKLLKVLKCETCIKELFSDEKLWFHKLIEVKNIGGLCFPSKDVFKICSIAETIIKSHIKEKGHIIISAPRESEIIKNKMLKSFINRSDVFQSLSFHSLQQPATSNHRLHLIRAILEKFVNVRLHFAHKNIPNCEGVHKKEKRNKLCLFEGI